MTKYATDEQRKAGKAASRRKWYLANREKIIAYNSAYAKERYRTSAAVRENARVYSARWRRDNPDKVAAQEERRIDRTNECRETDREGAAAHVDALREQLCVRNSPLIKRINSLIPRSYSGHDREDILSRVTVAILDGQVPPDRLKWHVNAAIRDQLENGQLRRLFVSLDYETPFGRSLYECIPAPEGDYHDR